MRTEFIGLDPGHRLRPLAGTRPGEGDDLPLTHDGVLLQTEVTETRGEDQQVPLGVKLTGYRLLYTSVILSFGISKAVLGYCGQTMAPTTLDWVAGTFLAVM